MSAQAIDVTLPDGSARSVPASSTALDLAQSIGSRLAKAAVAAVIGGEERDLSSPLSQGDRVAIVTADTDAGRHVLRHSTAHVLAQAVVQLFPGAKFTIGPAIEDGFYYDFDLPGGKTFSDDDLQSIEAKMREIVKADQPFVRAEMSVKEALALFSDQPYKCEIIQRVTSGASDGADAGEVGGGDSVSVYRNTDSFVDLCRGPHVPSTGRLGHFALMKVAGAYWRGNEKGPMLQRIYGTAWESKAALEEHLTRLAEAEKRDHRKLAVEMDLLSFPTELGGGLAVWHPKGAIVRKLMEDYSRHRHQTGGYQFVFTPHIANANLFETSGHLHFYKDGMYPAMEMDNGTYYPKPMNCPMHCLIYRDRQRSYRELPLRLFELGTVYRYERAGTLHGLL
ncbi:MAG: threonyl-tRNA synthetase, partial [Actinomycetota bacterium]